ncbi:MAG: GNAT family N-acetyltransferase [Candidatus Saccharibacteria bacterium]|nr:GNAT family N-acetyltransferase [Rhodoferax sp.]
MPRAEYGVIWEVVTPPSMYLPIVTLHPATLNEFDYIYGLCELTMRGFVEADLGDCFERIARPTITALLAKGLFSTLQKNGERVGAIAFEQKDTHFQLEELYVEPICQKRGIGGAAIKIVMAQAMTQEKPMRLHVLASNPAKVFYEKFGFAITRTTKEVNFMERALS